MVELDQFKYTLSTYVPMLKELGASLNLDAKKERIAELSRYMEAPDFWDDPERSQKMTKELKSLEDTVKSYTTLSTQYDDISELIEMGYEIQRLFLSFRSLLMSSRQTLKHSDLAHC